jgi:hypothetical protein
MKKVFSITMVLFIAAAVAFSCSKPAASDESNDSSKTKGDSAQSEHPAEHPSEHPAAADSSKIINMEK